MPITTPVAWLQSLPAASVDLLITDPAYESLEKHRAIGTTTRLKHSKASSNDWFTIFPNARFGELFREAYRVLKPNTHFYLFCDAETMFVAKSEAEQAGFRFWKPLVWDKCAIGMGYHYRARYEFILFFEKGKRRLNDLGVPDIISMLRIRGGYPAEKPAEVADVLIRQSSEPGDVVADPFMGSGSVGVAAARLGRRFLGNDLNDALDDVRALPMAGCIAYAGQGFSSGVLHMLAASPQAAYCLPAAGQTDTTSETRELDHVLAVHFGWWDVLVERSRPVESTARGLFEE